MPSPGKAPKPRWKELVAPYQGVQTGPTIRQHLQNFPGWLWASKGGRIWAVPLTPYIARYGLDITLPELQRHMKADGLSLATHGRNNEYRFPPIDQVPDGLRRYAGIDPAYLPAPLRG